MPRDAWTVIADAVRSRRVRSGWSSAAALAAGSAVIVLAAFPAGGSARMSAAPSLGPPPVRSADCEHVKRVCILTWAGDIHVSIQPHVVHTGDTIRVYVKANVQPAGMSSWYWVTPTYQHYFYDPAQGRVEPEARDAWVAGSPCTPRPGVMQPGTKDGMCVFHMTTHATTDGWSVLYVPTNICGGCMQGDYYAVLPRGSYQLSGFDYVGGLPEPGQLVTIVRDLGGGRKGKPSYTRTGAHGYFSAVLPWGTYEVTVGSWGPNTVKLTSDVELGVIE